MIEDIGEELHNDTEMQRPNLSSFQTTKRMFKRLERMLQRRFIRQLQYQEGIRNCALQLLPVPSKTLLLMRIWLGYLNTIMVRILLPQALWPVEGVQAASQLQIGCCEDGKYWQDGCSWIRVVGGYFSAIWMGWWMRNNLEFFGEDLGLFLLVCVLYYYTTHILARRAQLRVHDVGIHRWADCFWTQHSGSNWTLCMAIMNLAVQYWCLAELAWMIHETQTLFISFGYWFSSTKANLSPSCMLFTRYS